MLPPSELATEPCALVTGATGFVGGELVKTLLETSTRRLVCPVRADNADHATQRGAARLAELFGSGSIAVAHRVRWVRADLEERQLGWTTNQCAALVGEISEVFHCAASVQFDLPLDEARRINVDGTVNVFELAKAAHRANGSFRRFHHVSTAYVAGPRKGVVQPGYLPSARAANYRNTYEQTKAEAERWLRAQASDDIPVSVHRPSIVGGHITTGATNNWNVLYVPMKMAARGMLPVFTCGGRQLVDSVGVDFVVQAMAVFAELDTQRYHCHHLTAGQTAFTTTDLIRVTETRAKGAGMNPSSTVFMHPRRWAATMAALKIAARLPKRFASIRRKGVLASRAAGAFSVYVPYTAVDAEYDARKDHETLKAHGVEMPNAHVYLATIVDYALAADFGKRTLPVGRTEPPVTQPALTSPTGETGAPAPGVSDLELVGA